MLNMEYNSDPDKRKISKLSPVSMLVAELEISHLYSIYHINDIYVNCLSIVDIWWISSEDFKMKCKCKTEHPEEHFVVTELPCILRSSHLFVVS